MKPSTLSMMFTGRTAEKLKGYFWRPRWPWAVAALASIAGAATEPMVPALLQPLLDKGFDRNGIELWMVPVVLILLFFIRGFSGFVAKVSLAKVSNDGLMALRRDMFERMQTAEFTSLARHSASDLSNTIVYEVQNGAQQLVYALLNLAKDSLTLIALLGYLLYLNWQLSLFVAVLFPTVVWIMRTFTRRVYRITKDTQQATDRLAYVIEENVLAHRVIRLHEAQEGQQQRFGGLSKALRQLNMKATLASAAMTPLTQMMAAMTLSAVVTLALWQSSTSGETVGSFVAFVTCMLMLVAPLKSLSELANPITRGLAALERGLDLLDEMTPEPQGAHAGERARGEIRFDRVTVGFADDRPPVLHELSLDIRAGEVVALVGPSGAGKTTLVNLLPRFVLPRSGGVLLDGRDIDEWSVHALRRQIAMVSQDIVMLNLSVAENVALGKEVDRERVRQCLDAANLWTHVHELPEGMDTLLGHNASALSGGQRQRLAIARALYKDAPILILDEATSALDTESERLVQQALRRLMSGRTTLVIAHRLSTIEHADRVVVMERGRIAELGTHEDLLARGGLYARLHQYGFQDAAPEGAIQ